MLKFVMTSAGMSVNPQGYYVITPLHLNTKEKTVVFVNRGWVGIKDNNWHKPTGDVTLNTVITKAEKKNTFTAVNSSDIKSNTNKILIWTEPSAILKLSGINATPTPTDGDNFILVEEVEDDGAPITAKENGSPYPVCRRNKHVTEQHVMPFTHIGISILYQLLQYLLIDFSCVYDAVYAVTWFSLTAFGLYLTRLRFKKNVRRPPKIV